MEIKRVALVMVDISGYTRFTRLHTTSLLHAEMIITELLETVLNQAEYPLTLSKLEGDAAFLYVVLDQDDQRARAAVQNVTQQVMSFFDAFRSKERELIACDACVCEACRNISKLQLKAFLHIGQAAFKQIRQFEELAGEDVIIIHRLMKNTIPAKEYTLMTEAYYDMSGGMDVGAPETRTVDCEGIGEVVVKVYYPAAPEAPFPPPLSALPAPGSPYWPLAMRFNRYVIPRLLGRVPNPQFSHLPSQRNFVSSILDVLIVGSAATIAGMVRYLLRVNTDKQQCQG